jgi:anti-anti-sigma regulatory factor
VPERMTRELSLLEPLAGGDHVAWVTRQPDEFEWMAATQMSQGTIAGDKLLLLAPAHRSRGAAPLAEGVTVVDPVQDFLHGGPLTAESMISAFREEADQARREGYRGIRMVADMDWLLDVPADFARVVDFEQRLDRMVADTGALMVCVFRPESFVAGHLAELMSVHPHSRPPLRPGWSGFRIWSAGGGRWRVSGEVDMNNTAAFAARLASASASVGSGSLFLDLRRVTFIDVAGLRAIVRCSLDHQVGIVVEGLRPAMRTWWDLLEFSHSAPSVEVKV